MTLARHLLSIALLPGTVLLVVPFVILRAAGGPRLGWDLPWPALLLPLAVSVLLAGTGLALVAGTVRLFVRVGRGTLAPWDPTQRLVVVGVYRYVRNPMISGVCLLLAAEALALGSPGLAAWAGLFAIVNGIYIPLSEEPGLVRRFGQDYEIYRANVPRWIPRRTPWSAPWQRPGADPQRAARDQSSRA